MKRALPVIVVLLILLAGWIVGKRLLQPGKAASSGLSENQESLFRNGDILFQTSLSTQSKAIQAATRSKYSHCGILYKKGNELYVLEAIQPVSITPIRKWIDRGANAHYVVKRLKNADEVLTGKVLQKMEVIGTGFLGKNYDLTFEWSDEKIYCSELIWKIYQRATGIEIGKTQQLKDFDLSALPVRKKLAERYGTQIPWNEQVISPAAIFESPLLETVIQE